MHSQLYILSAPLSQAFLLIMGFGFGAIMTSFACLVAERLPHQLGWREDAQPNLSIWSPPSFCNHCRVPIETRFLIPILGWVIAKGRCVHCGWAIPKIYPALECALGLACALILSFLGTNWYGISTVLLLLTLFTLSLIDWREAWLPEVITLPLFWVGLMFSPLQDPLMRIWGSFAGFGLMTAAMLLISRSRSENTLAGGDIMLAAVMGAWLGWPYILPALLLASVTFVAQALFSKQEAMPAGPALSFGFFTLYLWAVCTLSSSSLF